jgi:hypothetical protein
LPPINCTLSPIRPRGFSPTISPFYKKDDGIKDPKNNIMNIVALLELSCMVNNEV